MKVACPSCQALFEADDSTVAGPGLLLCETCSTLGDAPPLPPPPPVEGRRKRPRMPELHFSPRGAGPAGVAEHAPVARAPDEEPPAEQAPPVASAAEERPAPSSGERISLGDLEVLSAPPGGAAEGGRGPAAPAVLDGGFGWSEQPVSVFPPAPFSMRGAELSLGDYASDVEPVSLHDLGVVLAPPPLPPAWSGSAIGSSRPATPPSPAGGDAPEPASAGAQGGRPKRLRAARRAKGGSKPSFFQVDSIPPPPSSEDVDLDGLAAEEAPKPSSRRSDLGDLIRLRTSDRPKRGLDLAGLTGALFDELPPPDLSLLAEPIAVDEPPPPEPLPQEPSAPAPVRRVGAPPPRAPRSPAPVVAERRAAKPGGGAGGVIAFIAAGVAVGIAAFQLGARTAPAPSRSVVDAPPSETAAPRRDEARGPGTASPSRAAPAPSPSPGPPAGATAASARPATERRPIAEAPRAPRNTVPAKDTLPPVARPPAQPQPTAAPAAPPPGGGPFDGAVAGAALARAAAAAAGCRQGDDPSGGARVSITFAPSGRVTSARVVGPPFQGTRTGGCIALSFGSASVPSFTGDPVTVSTDVNVR